MDASGEASIIALGDEFGFIKIIHTGTLQPVLVHKFDVPSTYFINEDEEETGTAPPEPLGVNTADPTRKYGITSLALHPTGLHLVLGASCGEAPGERNQ